MIYWYFNKCLMLLRFLIFIHKDSKKYHGFYQLSVLKGVVYVFYGTGDKEHPFKDSASVQIKCQVRTQLAV